MTQRFSVTGQVSNLSASAWTSPFVLMCAWGILQLWLHGSPIQSLSQDLIMALIYSSVIAGSMLPTINRYTTARLSSGREQSIIEDTLGCLLTVLVLTVLLAIALLTNREYFRDPLHLSTQLASVALMSNCWILSTVLLSCGKSEALLNSYIIGGIVLTASLLYEPLGGLSYHSLAWLCGIATTVLIQAYALTRFLPMPRRIGLSLACGRPSSVELSLAGTSLCLAIWLSRPSAHSSVAPTAEMLLLEQSQTIAYLILLPVAMLAWKPLETRFKHALLAFEEAANEGGNLATLDYQKNNLIFQSQTGMQRVHIALIAAVVICLAFNKIYNGQFSYEEAPSWLMPLILVHVALQMVTLCAMRLLFYLQRDRELLIILLIQLALVAMAVKASHSEHSAIAFTYSLTFSSIITCVLAVWFLRHRLARLDYLFFMGGQQIISEPKSDEHGSSSTRF